MIYSPLVYKAMKIAYEAHHDVYDKNGAPYIFHPFTVASSMDDETSTCVALLHNVSRIPTSLSMTCVPKESRNRSSHR